jgi:PEP-CTERM motif
MKLLKPLSFFLLCTLLLSGLVTTLPAQTFRVVSGAGTVAGNTNGSTVNAATSTNGGAFLGINNSVTTRFSTTYTPSTSVGGPSPSGLWQTLGAAGQPTYLANAPRITTNNDLRDFITGKPFALVPNSNPRPYDLAPIAGTLSSLWNPTPNPTHLDDRGNPLDSAQDVSVLVAPPSLLGDEWDKFFRYDVFFTVPSTFPSNITISGEVRSDNSLYDIIYDYNTINPTIMALGGTQNPLPPGTLTAPNPNLRTPSNISSIASFVSPTITLSPGSSHTLSFITYNSHDTQCDSLTTADIPVCSSPATLLFDFKLAAAIPEPTTLALISLGSISAWCTRRRNT